MTCNVDANQDQIQHGDLHEREEEAGDANSCCTIQNNATIGFYSLGRANDRRKNIYRPFVSTTTRNFHICRYRWVCFKWM